MTINLKYFSHFLFTYLLVLTLFCTNSFGYEWIKTYGGIDLSWDGGNPMDRTDDGGYVIIGYTITSPYPNYTSDLVLVKTDGNGNEQWRKPLRHNQINSGYSIQQTNDGGYVITGSTVDANGSGALLMKTDVNGNKEWSKILSGDTGYSVQQSAGGGYIILGTKGSGIGIQSWMSLIRTDANGNELWSKTFAEYQTNYGSSVQQTSDGGYIAAGTTSTDLLTNYFYLLKTDGNGNQQWSKTFEGKYGYNWGYSVQQTTDGGYIIAGDTSSLSGDNNDFCFLIKTDSNGNKQWSKALGGDNNLTSCSSVQQTTDGGYIIAGDTFPKTGSDSNTDIYLIKTDDNGFKQWSRTFGGNFIDYALSVQQTNDGGYITCGVTDLFDLGESVAYLLYYRPSESKAMPWIPFLLLDE